MIIGVVVGRFQVANLTEGHKLLIKKAKKNFDKVIIVIGITKDGKLTSHDPLPYKARKKMVEEFLDEQYKEWRENEDFIISKIRDVGNYPVWVENLDCLIDALLLVSGLKENTKNVIIYGSRKSVAEKYKENGGKYDAVIRTELVNSSIDHTADEHGNISGTLSREFTRTHYKPVWDEKDRKFAVWLTGNI